MADFKLKYIIDADGKKLKSELRSVDDQIARLGGRFSAVSGLSATQINAIGTAAAGTATAILAIGVAAIAVGTKIFDLSRQAADFGSEIFDASKKTGLAAETLSAMKFAADQSGSSLENITAGIAKFAKEVGAAADGSEKAAAKIRDLGIDPQEAINDLDGALAKVFKRIQDAPPGIERMTLAQKAFGKSGADLLPFIDSFSGDLTELTRKAKELGVTIDDEAAAAADAFGDQLDTLSAQLSATGRTIGEAFMPMFMNMAEQASEWATRNKVEIELWSIGFAKAVEFTASTIINNIDAFAGLGEILIGLANYDWLRIGSGIERIGQAISNQRGAWKHFRTGDAGGVAAAGRRAFMLPGDADPDSTESASKKVRPKKDGQSDAEREAERAERERIALIKESTRIQIAEKQAAVETLIQLEKQRFAEGILSEEAYVEAIRTHETSLTNFIIDAKVRELDALQNNADEKRRLDSEIRILNSEAERQQAEYAENDAKRRKDKAEKEEADHKKRVQRWNETIRRLQEISDAEDAAFERELKRSRNQYEAGMATAPGTLYGGMMSGVGVELISMFDEATNAMLTFQQRLQLVAQDINHFVGSAIGGLIQGLAQMGAAWLAGGEFSMKAALQMISAAALSVATQAVFKAIFEQAEAVAAAARWDFVGAAMHMAAAKLYWTAAAVAGGIGIGAGLAARAMGNGSGGSAGGGGRGSASTGEGVQFGQNRPRVEDLTPLSRYDENTFISGRRTESELIARAVEKLTDKIDSMSAGDVLVRGSEQKRGFISRTTVDEMGKNNSIARAMNQRLGITR